MGEVAILREIAADDPSVLSGAEALDLVLTVLRWTGCAHPECARLAREH